jgi:hypothetical protein
VRSHKFYKRRNPINKVIVVLGMHRSGTSAIMRVLNLWGVDIGKNVEGKNEDNPTGYWENASLHSFHESLLISLGCNWLNPYPIPDRWWMKKDARDMKIAMSSFIQEEFSESKLWGFKDPRACILLPLWLDVFEELKITPYFVIILRNPREVALSLQKRDKIEITDGEKLWDFYMQSAYKWSAGYPRVFITYEDILEKEMLFSIKKYISVVFGIDFLDAGENEIDQFLSYDLRHHRYWGTDVPSLYLDLLKGTPFP